jgi:NitT/TauT family transport system substrate-binding protein
MRTPEGTREFYGVDAIPLYALSAKSDWLNQRPEDARRVTRAMRKTLQWVREHPIDEVYARMRPFYRSEFKEGDMESLRVFISALSPDGRMPAGGAEAVQRVVSAADDRVLKIDLASTWTNDFLEKAQ